MHVRCRWLTTTTKSKELLFALDDVTQQAPTSRDGGDIVSKGDKVSRERLEVAKGSKRTQNVVA